jgi:hypothetical protein
MSREVHGDDGQDDGDDEDGYDGVIFFLFLFQDEHFR